MTQKTNIDQGSWYQNSCALRYIDNKRERFSLLHPKSCKFVIMDKDTIKLEKVD